MAIHDDKPTVQVEEEVYENAPAEKLDDVHAQHSMPESLRGMSEGEIAALEKSIVRKIDMVVLYVALPLPTCTSAASCNSAGHHTAESSSGCPLTYRPIIVILYILNCQSCLLSCSSESTGHRPSDEQGHTDPTDIDRQNLAAAKLRGILPDLNMNTTQFATAIAILYGESCSRYQPIIRLLGIRRTMVTRKAHS